MFQLCFVNFLQISEKATASKQIVEYAPPLPEPDEKTIFLMRAEEPGTPKELLTTYKTENGLRDLEPERSELAVASPKVGKEVGTSKVATWEAKQIEARRQMCTKRPRWMKGLEISKAIHLSQQQQQLILQEFLLWSQSYFSFRCSSKISLFMLLFSVPITPRTLVEIPSFNQLNTEICRFFENLHPLASDIKSFSNKVLATKGISFRGALWRGPIQEAVLFCLFLFLENSMTLLINWTAYCLEYLNRSYLRCGRCARFVREHGYQDLLVGP